MSEFIEVGSKAYEALRRTAHVGAFDTFNYRDLPSLPASLARQAVSDGDSCILLSIRLRRRVLPAGSVPVAVDTISFDAPIGSRLGIIVRPGSHRLSSLTKAIRSRVRAVVHVPPATGLGVTFLTGFLDLAAGRWSGTASVVDVTGPEGTPDQVVDLRHLT